MTSIIKVGIFGGSFNPIHNGHVKLVKKILQENLVDEVWVMPCKKHPLAKVVEDEKYRSDMIKLALEDVKNAKFCDFELRKKGTSYTYQTLRKLKKEYPHNFSFIIGSDILLQMEKWHGREYLEKEAKFILSHRPGYAIGKTKMHIEAIVDFEPDDTSSTEVRRRIKTGESISKLVPRAVEEYIKRNNLYTQ